MTEPSTKTKRGFTSGEKWIIWGVFCLLVALSTHRFSVFVGLILFSFGASLVPKKEKRMLGLLVAGSGLLSLVFSKFLI